jgi:3-oxoacyl-[acyl-carrier-protein] synthase II
MRRVVITGMGVIAPNGKNTETFTNNIFNGIGAAAPIHQFNTEKFKTKFACSIPEYNVENYFPKSEARKYDLYTQYALIASQEAIQDAQILNQPNINYNRVGVIWGSGNGGALTVQEQLREYAQGDGTPRFNPFFVPKMLIDSASGMISIKNGFKGINHTTVSACASATTALVDAYHYIKCNKADIIVSGGSDAPINESLIGGFNALKALSTQNENYATASKPFDKKRDGFVMGEGSAALIVEAYDHAIARGATIYAEIVGTGLCGDAYHMTASDPEGDGAYRAMKEACEEAGISPNELDYLNPHATSTPVGDECELKAIQRLFGDNQQLIISATKSMTGHLLGAAGAIEAAITIQALLRQEVPPTINTSDIEDMGTLNIQLTEKKKHNMNYAMSNTFGFGGHIATILFKRI